MIEEKFYRVYSKYLKDKYGEKVYKLPINLVGTCPNRDGFINSGGCIFCGEEGGSFENLSNKIGVREQLQSNMEYIKKRYKAKKFIAYFQNFTNTYYPLEEFKKYIKEALIDDIVEISVSTRPDSINDEYLEFLKEIEREHSVNITIELGLQTVNYHTLKIINRGHTLAEFIDASIRIKKYGFEICAHVILNFPWDDMLDTVETSKVISALNVDQVKLHSLYVVEDTVLSKMYLEENLEMIGKDEYVDRVIAFLEHLNPETVVQRLIGRAPEENTLFVNWNTSWWKIKDEILEKMEKIDSFQGKEYNYLNGKALKRFN